MNPPATNMWKATADLLTQGLHMLPQSAIWAIVIGAGLGVLLPVIENFSRKRARICLRRWGSALVGGAFQNAFSFAIGAVIVHVWQKFNRKNSTRSPCRLRPDWWRANRLSPRSSRLVCTIVGLLSPENDV